MNADSGMSRRDMLKATAVLTATAFLPIGCAEARTSEFAAANENAAKTLRNLLGYTSGVSLEDFTQRLIDRTAVKDGGAWMTNQSHIVDIVSTNGTLIPLATNADGNPIGPKESIRFLYPGGSAVRPIRSDEKIEYKNAPVLFHGANGTMNSWLRDLEPLSQGTTIYFDKHGGQVGEPRLFINYASIAAGIHVDEFGFNFSKDAMPLAFTSVDVDFLKDGGVRIHAPVVLLNLHRMHVHADTFGFTTANVVRMALANEKANYMVYTRMQHTKETQRMSEAPSLLVGYLAYLDPEFSKFFLGNVDTLVDIIGKKMEEMRAIGGPANLTRADFLAEIGSMVGLGEQTGPAQFGGVARLDQPT